MKDPFTPPVSLLVTVAGEDVGGPVPDLQVATNSGWSPSTISTIFWASAAALKRSSFYLVSTREYAGLRGDPAALGEWSATRCEAQIGPTAHQRRNWPQTAIYRPKLSGRMRPAIESSILFSFETVFTGRLKAGPQIETWQRRSVAAFTPAVILFIALSEAEDNIEPG